MKRWIPANTPPPVLTRRSRLRLAALAFALLALPLALVTVVRRAAPRSQSPSQRPAAVRAVVAGVPVIRPVSSAERSRYLGSASCVPCHAREAGQLQSHHALTGAPVTPAHAAALPYANSVTDPQYGVVYRMRSGNAGLELHGQRGTEAASVRAEYVLGSGVRAYTYMGHFEGQLVEMRLSYWSQAQAWDFTPGQEPGYPVATRLGRNVAPDEAGRCFACHATAVVNDGGTLKPEASLLGVGCETCHGPGRDHVEAVTRGDRDLRMANLSGARDRISLALCGQCHRSPVTSGTEPQGVEIQLPRLQGIALARSACFKKSGGHLSCITCHDPHRDAYRTSHAEYNAVCSSCHNPVHPPQKPCKRQPQGDCVSCHMPAQTVILPTRPQFRTHWIKVW